jgi:hypothetical protein
MWRHTTFTYESREMLELVTLFHATDQTGRDGIEATGFAVSCTPDAKAASWFGRFKDPRIAASGNAKKVPFFAWWVIVDLPDDVVALYLDPDLEDIIMIPWVVVNECQPFTYEPYVP